MIVGVDIGGTKTYIAVFAENGKLLKEVRFETSRDYDEFLKDLEENAARLETNKAKIACVAVPGSINQEKGIVEGLGNLPWKDKYIRHDLSIALGIQSVHIENDANLAGLAEARALPKQEKLVLYITLSTGIGSGIIINNKLIPELCGSEAGQMFVHDKNGNAHRWETFASGRALVESTGKRAEELNSEKHWKLYVEKICLGLQPAISVLRPQVVILGGGVGAHLNKFQSELKLQLQNLNHSKTYKTPKVVPAFYGEQSVVYGCYEYAKDKLA